ncbi:MAG: hypothetical protein CVU28_00510 [Betaproteobacteria bacterium HGW-Betaproteobacteria-21]|nr:MAG: hypothetical protein CVU28_00510 [Betaproteobacteria bacterium HGW-Betaproteobacteria-21]
MIRNRKLLNSLFLSAFGILAASVPLQASAITTEVFSFAKGEIVYWNYDGTEDYSYRTYSNSYGVGVNTSGPNPGEIQFAIEYDLFTMLTSPITVTSATLSVMRGRGYAGCIGLEPCPVPAGLSVYGYAGNGALATDDFDAGALLSVRNTLPPELTIMAFDVTDFIAGLVASSSRYAGLNFRAIGEGAFNVAMGEDQDGNVVRTIPQLRITYVEGSGGGNPVPEPATLALIGIGLAAIRLTRHR